MHESYFLDPVQILYGASQPVIKDSVLIDAGQIIAFGEEASNQAKKIGLTPTEASRLLLAPCLVDPHSILEEPTNGHVETLKSLREMAAQEGYGQLALLPRSSSWRDKPERLMGFNDAQKDVRIHLWGSFSRNSEGQELTPHADLLQHGAIGLADDDEIPPLELLKQSFVLGEMGASPILIAPRDTKIQGKGIVREGIETLRAGWAPDPIASETLPIGQLLELHRQHPEISMRLMNISTAEGISCIQAAKNNLMASVSWWHVVADSSQLSATEEGWRVSPSLGGPLDRKALINALRDGTITSIAVHSIALDEEQSQQPIATRLAGISGHHLVLPSLWQELVVNSGFSIEKLWELLSFGPSKMLNTQEESIRCKSRRWLLFDPDLSWKQNQHNPMSPSTANQPWQGKELKGKVIACGLRN